LVITQKKANFNFRKKAETRTRQSAGVKITCGTSSDQTVFGVNAPPQTNPPKKNLNAI
jgi:hypothetical protein